MPTATPRPVQASSTATLRNNLRVIIPDGWQRLLGKTKMAALRKVLELDPRPHYHADNKKVYGMPFEGFDIHFRVQNGILTVEPCPGDEPACASPL